ncbi:hypothetical protein ACFL1B_02570, partial [Nanoarchaeota archaeon]
MVPLKVLEDAALAAGKFALENHDNVKATGKVEEHSEAGQDYQEDKVSFSFVDAGCQKIIMEMIGEKYPKQMGLIAEEADKEIAELTS